jgi:hypothetical protein
MRSIGRVFTDVAGAGICYQKVSCAVKSQPFWKSQQRCKKTPRSTRGKLDNGAVLTVRYKQVARLVKGQSSRSRHVDKGALHPVWCDFDDATAAVRIHSTICHKQVARVVKGQSISVFQAGCKSASGSIRCKFIYGAAAEIRYKQVACAVKRQSFGSNQPGCKSAFLSDRRYFSDVARVVRYKQLACAVKSQARRMRKSRGKSATCSVRREFIDVAGACIRFKQILGLHSGWNLHDRSSTDCYAE